MTTGVGHDNISASDMSKILALGKVPYGVFLVLFVVCAAVSIFSLRQNNQQMVELRNKVYETDQNSGDVEGPLRDLRAHVYSHMNTDLSSGGNAIKPPIQLKYTYERLVAAEQQGVDAANSSIYTEAQEHCQNQNSAAVSGRSRVPCVEEYVTSRGGAEVKPIPAGLYKYDFVSPLWSPDLAGWSMVASVILFILFLASFLMDRLLRLRIKSQQI